MSWVAVAIGGAALIGGATSYMGAQKQSKSADRASQIQADMFHETQHNLNPWLNTGTEANKQLADMTGIGGDPRTAYLTKPFDLNDFQASPSYQFNLQEGENAINKAARARGNYYAPATLRDTARYASGLASNEFTNAYNRYNTDRGNIWNRMFALSGSGQNAAAQQGAFGANTANNIAGNTIGSGNAQAAGLVGAGNAFQAGAGQFTNYMLMRQMMQQPITGAPTMNPMPSAA